MTTSARAPVTEGDVLAGKYVVERVLGAGGMGVVVAARHVQLGSTVALKFMLDAVAKEPDVVARFLREAQSVTRITSEHVARVLDFGQLESGAPFMVMEYLEGSDLAKLVEDRGPLPMAEAIDYVLQACRALIEAHGKGIVHRDIKPSNLFLSHRYDGTPLVKVLDFGIAKTTLTDAHAPGELTQTQSMMGSPLYASPEQLDSARHANERADIWALGVTLHYLVSGQHPFYADSHAKLIASIMMGSPTPLRRHWHAAPELLERFVLKCLERDPSRRFNNVREFVAALSNLGDVGSTRPSSPPVGEGTAALSNPAPLLGGLGEHGRTTMPHAVTGGDAGGARPAGRLVWLAAALLAVAAGVSFLALRGRQDPPATSAASAAAASETPATSAPTEKPTAEPSTVAATPTAVPSETPLPAAVEPSVVVAEPVAAKPTAAPLTTPPPKAARGKPVTGKVTSPSERKAPAPAASSPKHEGVDSLLDERR